MNKKLAILTVHFIKNEAHANIVKSSYETFPEGYCKLAIQNANDVNIDLSGFVDKILINDKNILARAWNKGLKELFKTYEYVFCSNLDVMYTPEYLKNLYTFAKRNRKAGFWAGQFTSHYLTSQVEHKEVKVPIAHGDGSFSSFIISKELFEKVGDFDENFSPAYFEDNDYLERIWKAGYKPLKTTGAVYYHLVQGSVKHDEDTAREYPKFMQKNLEYFISKYGKEPDHLKGQRFI